MILCATNCSTPHVKCSAPCHLPRSTTQNGRASAARQALLSEDAAPSGLLGPKLARNAERMRQKRAPSRKSSADATGQPPSKKARAPRSKASDADRKRQERAPSPPSRFSIFDFRRCDGSGFKQEGTRPRVHPPLRSIVCCVGIGTGARSAAKMLTACLRRFVEGGRNGL